MKVYDEVLQKEEKVHEFVGGKEGIEIKLNDPADFAEIFKNNTEDNEDE